MWSGEEPSTSLTTLFCNIIEQLDMTFQSAPLFWINDVERLWLLVPLPWFLAARGALGAIFLKAHAGDFSFGILLGIPFLCLSVNHMCGWIWAQKNILQGRSLLYVQLSCHGHVLSLLECHPSTTTGSNPGHEDCCPKDYNLDACWKPTETKHESWLAASSWSHPRNRPRSWCTSYLVWHSLDSTGALDRARFGPHSFSTTQAWSFCFCFWPIIRQNMMTTAAYPGGIPTVGFLPRGSFLKHHAA